MWVGHSLSLLLAGGEFRMQCSFISAVVSHLPRAFEVQKEGREGSWAVE